MKKLILSILVTASLFSACSNNGNKAETKKAEDVKLEKHSDTETFNKVKENSFINWRASHLGGAQARFGKIFLKKVDFLVNDGKLSNASVNIDMSSLTVESFPKGAPQIAKLTNHLKSKDFFNVEKYPTSKFELTNIEKTNGDFNSKVTGNLTILDVTKSISFKANVNVSDSEVSIKSEDFSINRTDWNLTYNTEGTAGVPVDYLIANDVGFTINVTATK